MIEWLFRNKTFQWLAADKHRFAVAASCASGLLGGLMLGCLFASVGLDGPTFLVGFIIGAPLAGLLNYTGMARMGFFDDQKDQ